MQKESHAFMNVVTSYKGFRVIKVTFSGVFVFCFFFFGTGFRMSIIHHSTHEGQGYMMQKESHAFMYVVASYKGFRGGNVTFSGVLGLREGGKGV